MVVITGGGGVAVCTCQYSRRLFCGGPTLSIPRTNRTVDSQPALLIGCTTSRRRITHTRTSSSSSSSGGGRRRRMTTSAAATSATETLKKGIAEFYDQSSGVWEDVWGDHMHHGFYEPASDVSLSDHRSAQIRMIEESLRFASLSDDSVQKPKSIVDVGCGIGGSSRYLAKKYGAKAQGITLSPVQAQRAQELASAQGLDAVSFQVADALNQPFPDGQFDLVWSMESGEHMPDKTKFVNELVRVAAPGGTIIVVTWCHRDLSPSEESLLPDEKNLLDKICDAYYLPAWCSTADYVKLLQSHSLEDIKSEDWSQYVAPFWPAVIKSALTWKGITSLLSSGWKTIRGALAMPLMIQGYKKGLIKFAIITCRKPAL
ncbi:PREDICTED: tocopherol O-methyltransferase, chloroplastic isoform X2 [Erythranthe guttata]|uniref:tocopherol O-methyltransferase, chloroplastic isoform X2 n=1 Tax=Erythranthe guttata TaxID=4155 RepID=UPI00064D7348|nr:PREDICTED: tocopherol O-methyltransferase, chloroplastic isoform X2 [Erythranthe guttata]|eukprot:XP_012840918.1 PREDICTED: tocopherol O-methyltransferase, chloroplastic isoform X2 [Erythranthe guttata]